jgi:hypothetical protein
MPIQGIPSHPDPCARPYPPDGIHGGHHLAVASPHEAGIPHAFGRLGEELARLEGFAAKLADVLAPVLAPAIPEAAGRLDSVPTPPRCPLADEILANAGRLAQLREALEQTLRRIDLI